MDTYMDKSIHTLYQIKEGTFDISTNSSLHGMWIISWQRKGKVKLKSDQVGIVYTNAILMSKVKLLFINDFDKSFIGAVQ